MIKKQARPYQLEAVARWHTRTAGGLGLFHEQRVGKNLIALSILDIQRPRRTLIVTRKKGIKVWKKEIAESLTTGDWEHEPELCIIHFSELQKKSVYNRLKRWLRTSMSFMIVDEAHRIKKRGSVWSRRCRALGKYSEWRLALTGTPIAQGIQDSWAIFDFIDPRIFGKWAITEKQVLLGGKVKITVVGGFQHKYLIMDPFWRSKVIGTQNEEEFYEIFHRHSVRKTLAEAQREAGRTPTRVHRRVITGQLGAFEREHYDRLEADLETVVNRRRVEAPLVITLSTKLQQIAGGFLIDNAGKTIPLGNSKQRLLLMHLPEPKKNKKIVVVCRYLHEIDAVEGTLLFKGYTVKRIQGGTEFDPNEAIKENAIIVQVQSGEAIDLAVADLIIFYSWNFSMIDYEQVRFRVLQYSSTKISYIYLVMKNTVDELILEAVRSKKRFADVVCDHYRRGK